jgi:hypothetical protein
MKVSLLKYSAFVGICSLYILKMHGESSIKIEVSSVTACYGVLTGKYQHFSKW